MKFAEATKLHRKSGVWGTLRVSCGRELPGDGEVEREKTADPSTALRSGRDDKG